MSEAQTIWLAAASLALFAASVAIALGARSLFAAVAALPAAGAAVGVVLTLSGHAAAALTTILLGCAWAPLLLLASILLSKRAVRPRKGVSWPAIAATAALAPVIAWAGLAEGVPVGSGEGVVDATMNTVWLAPVLAAASLGCQGLIGFGERGVWGRGNEG